jgi:hypothetical protein
MLQGPDKPFPKEHEVTQRKPLIFCEKTEGISGFSKITLSQEILDKTPGETRRKIVKQLESREGLIIQFERGGETIQVMYKNRVQEGGGSAFIRTLDNNGKVISYLSIRKHTIVKGHVGESPEVFQGYGLTQIAQSLAIEIIKSKEPDVSQITSNIEADNFGSILSCVHTPNLLEKGYYHHELRPIQDEGKDFIIVTTHLKKTATLDEIKNLPDYPISTVNT